ncbi:hypothetical protein [Streptomyces sp. WG7]|uniref:NACHT N-terminal Helical domain 1-containing protein n=1 Tax=Streptomyces sp. WG7 TaxID=3417650 RepID=UPI003CF231DD
MIEGPVNVTGATPKRPFGRLVGGVGGVDPAAFGTRLAAGPVGPPAKQPLVREGPGAGPAARPVRLSAPVSFRGERRTPASGGSRASWSVSWRSGAHASRPAAETELDAVTDALHRTPHALGDLDPDDVQAVRLGREERAARLHEAAGGDADLRRLDADAEALRTLARSGAASPGPGARAPGCPSPATP